MRYIVVDRLGLSVTVQSQPGEAAVTVPVLRPILRWPEHVDHFVADAVFQELIVAKEAEDRAEGRHVAYALVPPDPWLVALGVLMWEGILQGLAWDVVKIAALAAVSKMRRSKVAPSVAATDVPRSRNASTRSRKTVSTKSELGFSWAEYTDGEKQRELFIGLRRQYRNEQRRVTRAKGKKLARRGGVKPKQK